MNYIYCLGVLSLDVVFDQECFDIFIGLQNEFFDELFIYVEDDMQLGKFKVNVGLYGLGFKVGDEFYILLQLCIGFNYLLLKDVALKVLFVIMVQFINLLMSEFFSLFIDLWVLSMECIKLQ